MLLVVKDQFPVVPLYRLQPIGDEYREALAVRRFFAEQKICLVHAVDSTVLRHLCPRDFSEGCIGIYLMNDFVAHAASRNFAGPTYDERNPQRAFHMREVVCRAKGRKNPDRGNSHLVRYRW